MAEEEDLRAELERLKAENERLKTQRGELAPLGHPDYGSRHHELIGQPNVERTRNLIKLYVLQALADEPRVQKVLACVVYAPHTPPRDQVRIEIELRLIDEPNPLNAYGRTKYAGERANTSGGCRPATGSRVRKLTAARNAAHGQTFPQIVEAGAGVETISSCEVSVMAHPAS